MTYDDTEVAVGRLIPNPKFTGRFGASNWRWTDTRPYPSQQDIDSEYLIWQAEKVKKVKAEDAYNTYYINMESGYTDNQGITWYCNERANTELAMLVVLNTLDEKEPVYVLSLSHGIQTMTYKDFKELAVKIGRHAYDIRKALWTALLTS